MNGWSLMRSRSVNKNKIPPKPQVEVYNMMDIITSIDKEQWKMQRRAELIRESKGIWGKIPVLHVLFKGKKTPAASSSASLKTVIFVPSSMGVQAKERIRANGNRKARLRPMRAWGKDA